MTNILYVVVCVIDKVNFFDFEACSFSNNHAYSFVFLLHT